MVTIMKATPVVLSARKPIASDKTRPAATPVANAGRNTPAEMHDRQPGAIEAGGEEHGVAEAEQAGIAEQEIVAHGEHGKHHDTRQHAVMIIRQQEVQREQQAR